MRKILVVLIFALVNVSAHAQLKDKLPATTSIKPEKGIVCYGRPDDQNAYVAPPDAYLNWKNKKSTKTTNTDFQQKHN
jgi:hypothetical protein